ncbi:RNAse E [Limimaricola soesokkakensis]|uniref:Ribonuclease E n=1 Tax=Limimaricola soesokkakensis TaxID=1343159 RepID=A0A1X6ZHH4_9RHOB|nr:ribonuclease E/G [Limimaricola soesokkakensis]PSK86029.1 RNAse E [Limimaricola soesokkakensis]SLN51215.1 Ribonuclease E [Limimaricola soesokkakensis]
MAKKMLIDATHAEETRVVVCDGNKVEEFDFESQSRRQLAGNIYLAKVTRVEPSLQAAFVDYGGNRHGFLAFSEIHPDYYQIPVADREALLAEEKAYAESLKAEAEAASADADVDESETDGEEGDRPRRRRSRSRRRASDANTDAVASQDSDAVSGMETIDPEGDDEDETDADTKDEDIESVADEDDSEDVRPARKPRPKRYKIQEVIKVRQIMLVQVVKEERGNKGAALTTYLSLAGRYCVLMPNTARGGGISRKITNAADRKKLKEIAAEMDVPEGAGLIIRTAGSQRTKSEIKRDYEYLQRLWEQIRELTLKSIAPAKIYEEGDLIKRSIRDLYSKDIDEVIVEGVEGFRIARDFMKMIMPSHAKNVKPYTDSLPLFARYQVESYLAGMFNPTVQLPSGGYIVIGVTEALVAIDVNSGRATKEGSIEQTALKTNLEAADEVARQLRLRDLAGLIVIDFIDMDERRNNTAVEKRFKDKLKTDRARIQVGRISGFGLLEMSRQRLRPGMLEATTQPCPHCHGTGLLRSDENVALAILRQLEEEGVRGRTKEVLVRVPYAIMNFLMNHKREHVAAIEQRYGMAVRVEGDPTLVSPDFVVEKFKTATRTVPEAAPVVSTAALMEELDAEIDLDLDIDIEEEDEEDEEGTEAATESASQDEPRAATDEDDKPRKKRRRRRRRRSGNGEGAETQGEEQSEDRNVTEAEADEAPAEVPEVVAEPTAAPVAEVEATVEPETAETAPAAAAEAAPEPEAKPKRTRTRTRKKEPAEDATPAAPSEADAPVAEEAPKPKRTRRKKAEPTEAEAVPAGEAEPAPKPKRTRRKKAEPKPEEVAETAPVPAEAEPAAAGAAETHGGDKPEQAPASNAPEVMPEVAEQVAETVAETRKAPEPEAETPRETVDAGAEDDGKKPRRRGWWSIGR